MRALVIAAALNVVVAVGPARATTLAPVQVVSVGPLPVQAPAPVTVRLRLDGGEAGAAAWVSFAATEVAMSRIETLFSPIREVHTEGPGGRFYTPPALDRAFPGGGIAPASLDSRAVPDRVCLRGGYFGPYSAGASATHAVQVDAGQTVDVVATVDVVPGLYGVPAGVTVRSSGVDQIRQPIAVPVEDLAVPAAASPSFTIDLPRAGPVHDQVFLRLGPRAGKRVRLRGGIFPPRAGVAVQIAGRRTPNTSSEGEVLGNERIATAPIGSSMRHFAYATTDVNGRWATWVTLPPRIAVVARTAADPGVTLGGASCGLWFSSPTLDQRALDAKRKAQAERRRKANERNQR